MANGRQRLFIAGDPLRAIAALSVLVFHAAVFAFIGQRGTVGARDLGDAFGSLLGPVLGALDVGLYVFFVLSGYFVGGRFVRAWVNQEPLPRIGAYFGRRVRRIVPAFWAVVALVLLRYGTRGSSPGEIAAIFGFAQTLDPSPLSSQLFIQTWTLDVEAAFYVALPLVALVAFRARRGGRSQKRALVVIGLVALLGLASLLMRMSIDDSRSALARSLPALFFAFTPGLVFAALETDLARRPRGRGLAALMFVLALAAFVLLARTSIADESRRAPLLLACAGFLVGGALVWQWTTDAAPRVLSNRPLDALGRWSYGIYLIHVAVLEQLAHTVVPDDASPRKALVLLIATATPASVALAAASWRWLERPILEGRTPLRRRPAAEVGEATVAP